MPSTKPRPGSGDPGIALYSIPQLAELLGGCSKMHVYRLIADGQLRAVDIATPGAGRPKTRVRSDDLAAYIEKNTRTPSKRSRTEVQASGKPAA